MVAASPSFPCCVLSIDAEEAVDMTGSHVPEFVVGVESSEADVDVIEVSAELKAIDSPVSAVLDGELFSV